MKSHLPRAFLPLAALLACVTPVAAGAQTMDYGSAEGDGDEAVTSSARGSGGGVRAPRMGVKFSPYIEAAQVVMAELSPGNDTVTYSRVAAGVDAYAGGRNNQMSVSVRYERRIGWGGNNEDGDTISGIARVSASVVPRTLMIEAGAMATRTRSEGGGAGILAPLGDDDSVSQIYALYAGPALHTQAGAVDVSAHYRIGYTKLESPDALVVAPGDDPIDLFDDSVVHDAQIHAGVRPGDVLPIGIGVGAGYFREDVSNLDQRVEDKHVRGDVSIPVGGGLALVGGVGYEDVKISSRDALRDAAGVPVVGPGGRFVTDKSAPRIDAFDVSGLIWDAGVVWRPSRRTQFEAHVGKRYGSTSYWGSFAYSPNSHSSMGVAVYDNIAGFGGQLNRALAGMPAQFTAVRNPFSGDIGGCVAALEQGNCLSSAFGSVRSSTFRARGVMANYNVQLGRIAAGIGAGYDRRRFIAAPGTVLALANGVIDKNTWLAAYMNARLDEKSDFGANVYANWFQSGSAFNGDASAFGATAAYNRRLVEHLTGTLAVGIDGINRDDALEDFWSAQALVGLRYTF